MIIVMRSTVWLLCAALWLGCSAPLVSPAGDGGSSNSAAADAFVLPDLHPTDVNHGDVSAGCQRSVHLQGVSITRPVPFDVVIVADNSDSLSWSRDSLSAGLKNLLARVHGHEARFIVLTTTQYGASSKAALAVFTGKELVSWHDSVTGVPYAHPVTEYRQTCVDEKKLPVACPTMATQDRAVTVAGTWELQTPAPVAAITPAMTEAELGVQQKKIADAILALGGGGAQQEQPICTLNRYVAQNRSLLPKNVVFVVLTDEDDTSPPDKCLASYEFYQQLSSGGPTYTPCTSKCSFFQYGMTRHFDKDTLAFTCVPVDDKGTQHPEQAFDKTLVTTERTHCNGVTAADCTPDELGQANGGCGGGHLVKNCKKACSPTQYPENCSIAQPDNRVDICTQPFDYMGKRFQNFGDYCTQTLGPGWGDCKVSGYLEGPPSGQTTVSWSERANQLVPGDTVDEMIQSFNVKATGAFGAGKYSVETIILDPAFNCPLRPGQSYAPNLRKLATSAADVFPLCQDYAPALARVESFAEHLVQTSFPLALDEYEKVDSVIVTTRAGVQRTVPPAGYQYDRAAKTLRFTPGVLGAMDDTLAVNVARYCERVFD
jgi:hypothetical protein